MLKLKGITKRYNIKKSNEFEALHGVNLTIDDGEIVAIIGKSGAGKSTLLHIIACIDSYEEGEYWIDDLSIKNLSENKLAEIRNKKIGIIMQDFALIEESSCIENVMLPLDFSKDKNKNKKEIAIKSLESVGMSSYARKPVNQLSGGQKQRVAIARAMVNEPAVLIADEPTGALDSSTTKEIMDLFHKIHKQGNIVIIVTHDMNIAEQCDRIIEISDGYILS